MDWDDVAAEWDEQDGVAEYAAAAFESLVAVARIRGFELTGVTACDFGCGTGALTEHLVRLCGQVDAVDSSPAMLDVLDAKIDRYGWTNVETLDRLPTGERRYDLVVCSSVLAFVDDHPATVRRLVASMRPGGLLAHWDWEFGGADDEPFGLTTDGIVGALRAAGLTSVQACAAFELDLEGHVMQPLLGVGSVPGVRS